MTDVDNAYSKSRRWTVPDARAVHATFAPAPAIPSCEAEVKGDNARQPARDVEALMSFALLKHGLSRNHAFPRQFTAPGPLRDSYDIVIIIGGGGHGVARDYGITDVAVLEKGYFTTRAGFATLDRLLGGRHANKAELLRALDRPDIPDAPTILPPPDLIRQRAAA